ncbi:MAG: hypothetical protein AAGN82_23735 [Myxococcota bacterium]
MSDLRRELKDELTSRAVGTAGRDAARRAVEDLLLSDDEKAARAQAELATRKRRRQKLLLYGVIGILLVVGVLGFLVSYWPYFLLAGGLGVAGLYGRHRWRQRKEARALASSDETEKTTAAVTEDEGAARRIDVTPPRPKSTRPEAKSKATVRGDGDPGPSASTEAADATARAEAAALEAQEIEDELAAMKARLRNE